MNKFAFFVDGSNLAGSLSHLSINIRDYESFYRFVFDEAAQIWESRFRIRQVQSLLTRIYWFVLHEMDDFDLSDQSQFVANLHEWFEKDAEWNRLYLAEAYRAQSGLDRSKAMQVAWESYLTSLRSWYSRKAGLIEGFKRFYHSLEGSTDFIEIRRVGKWRVNFKALEVEEKQLDTSVAVEMLLLKENYDVAVLISGDADNIPSVSHLKNHGKIVSVVEFLRGSPPENRSMQLSSKLRMIADFVVPVYEQDLLRHRIAEKR